jgi:predicted aldo/keto reductase-like oxidoreductase
MSDQSTFPNAIDRRGFLEAGATLLAAGSAIAQGSDAHAQDSSKDVVGPTTKVGSLPTRKLGKTGVDVSILNLGTWKSVGLDRILRYAWANGIRYVDTAKSYGSEPAIGRWLQAMPETRKNLFLVTKDVPRTPRELIAKLDERLAELQTDYVDLIFIHALGDHNIEHDLEWAKSKEFKETAEAIRKSGKAKFVGFSSHHHRKAEILQNAAEAGFVDAIMLQFTPWLENDAPLNRALDACHKKGIGLISMKQVAGHGELDQVPKKVPLSA